MNKPAYNFRTRNTARILALFLIPALALPSPAGAGPELSRRTLRQTAPAESEPTRKELVASLTNIVPNPVSSAVEAVRSVPIQAGMEEARRGRFDLTGFLRDALSNWKPMGYREYAPAHERLLPIIREQLSGPTQGILEHDQKDIVHLDAPQDPILYAVALYILENRMTDPEPFAVLEKLVKKRNRAYSKAPALSVPQVFVSSLAAFYGDPNEDFSEAMLDKYEELTHALRYLPGEIKFRAVALELLFSGNHGKGSLDDTDMVASAPNAVWAIQTLKDPSALKEFSSAKRAQLQRFLKIGLLNFMLATEAFIVEESWFPKRARLRNISRKIGGDIKKLSVFRNISEVAELRKETAANSPLIVQWINELWKRNKIRTLLWVSSWWEQYYLYYGNELPVLKKGRAPISLEEAFLALYEPGSAQLADQIPIVRESDTEDGYRSEPWGEFRKGKTGVTRRLLKQAEKRLNEFSEEIASLSAGLEESAEEMVKSLGQSSAPITQEQVEGIRFRILEETGEIKTESLENPFYVPGGDPQKRLSDLLRWMNAPPEARLNGIPDHQVSFDIPMNSFETGKLDPKDPVTHAGLVAWMMGNFPIFVEGTHRTGWALMNVLLLRSGAIRQPLVWDERRKEEYYKTLKRVNFPEFVALIRSYIPTGAGSSEDRQDPSTITLLQLIGTHPFPVRVFLGPNREEVYIRDSSGSMSYPQMTLLGQAIKIRMGNDYAAHLNPGLIYHLTTATPKDIEKQSVPRDRKVLMKLKGLIDQAGVTSSDMAVEAAVNHMIGPFSPDGKPSYARLIGYVNKTLRAEGNPRERLVFSTSISFPKEVAALDLWMVKEGDITHVFQAEVRLRDGLKARFAVNVSKDLAESSLLMQQAYHTMRADYTWDPRFVMELYGLGVGQATFWNGKREIPVSVGEWLDGFDELHLYNAHQGRFSVWQEHRTGSYETLSRPESNQIWESVVGIQALYSREEPGGIVLSQISINAGDFVARRRPDGSWQVILVWDRGKGPIPQGVDPSAIVMSSILPMAWDPGESSSSASLIFWGRPDLAVRAAYRAWLDHARYRSENVRFVRKRFLELAHRVKQVAIPGLFENRARLPYWNEQNPVDQRRMLLELQNTQNALATFLESESFAPSAGLEEIEKLDVVERRLGDGTQEAALKLLTDWLPDYIRQLPPKTALVFRIVPSNSSEAKIWELLQVGLEPLMTPSELAKRLKENYPPPLYHSIQLDEQFNDTDPSRATEQRLKIPMPSDVRIPGLPSVQEMVLVSSDAPTFVRLQKLDRLLDSLRSGKPKAADRRAVLEESLQLLESGKLRLENVPAFPLGLPDEEAKNRFAQQTSADGNRIASETQADVIQRRLDAEAGQQGQKTDSRQQHEQKLLELIQQVSPMSRQIQIDLHEQLAGLLQTLPIPPDYAEVVSLRKGIDRLDAASLIRERFLLGSNAERVAKRVQRQLQIEQERLHQGILILRERISRDETFIRYLTWLNDVLARKDWEAMAAYSQPPPNQLKALIAQDNLELSGLSIELLDKAIISVADGLLSQVPDNQQLADTLRLIQLAAVRYMMSTHQLSELAAQRFAEDRVALQGDLWGAQLNPWSTKLTPASRPPSYRFKRGELVSDAGLHVSAFEVLVFTTPVENFLRLGWLEQLLSPYARVLHEQLAAEESALPRPVTVEEVQERLRQFALQAGPLPVEMKKQFLLGRVDEPVLMNLSMVLRQLEAATLMSFGYPMEKSRFANVARLESAWLAHEYPEYPVWTPPRLAAGLEEPQIDRSSAGAPFPDVRIEQMTENAWKDHQAVLGEINIDFLKSSRWVTEELLDLEKTKFGLQASYENSYFIRVNGDLAGYLLSFLDQEGNLYLHRIAVKSGYRSLGVGKRGLHLLAANAEKRGIRTIWLHLWDGNWSAQKFFQEAGFQREKKPGEGEFTGQDGRVFYIFRGDVAGVVKATPDTRDVSAVAEEIGLSPEEITFSKARALRKLAGSIRRYDDKAVTPLSRQLEAADQLIDRGITSGANIQANTDSYSNAEKALVYSHADTVHFLEFLKVLRQTLPGEMPHMDFTLHQRYGLFKWKEEWEATGDTKLEKRGDTTIARAVEYDIVFDVKTREDLEKLVKFINERAFRHQPDAIALSWDVPTIQIRGFTEQEIPSGYRMAERVVGKNQDFEVSTILTRPANRDAAKGFLETDNEVRVEQVFINGEFYDFIDAHSGIIDNQTPSPAGLEEVERLMQAYPYLTRAKAEQTVKNNWTVEKLQELEKMNRQFSDSIEKKYGFTNRPALVFRAVSPTGEPIVTSGSSQGPVIFLDVARMSWIEVLADMNRWYLEEWVHSFQRDLLGGAFRETDFLSAREWKAVTRKLGEGVRAPDVRFSLPPFAVKSFVEFPLEREEVISLFDSEVTRWTLETHAAALAWFLALSWLPSQPSGVDDRWRARAFWESSIHTEEYVLEGLLRSGAVGTAKYGVPFLAASAGILEGMLEIHRATPFLSEEWEARARELLDRYTRAAQQRPMQKPEMFLPLKEAYKGFFLTTLQPFRDQIDSVLAARWEKDPPEFVEYHRALATLINANSGSPFIVKLNERGLLEAVSLRPEQTTGGKEVPMSSQPLTAISEGLSEYRAISYEGDDTPRLWLLNVNSGELIAISHQGYSSIFHPGRQVPLEQIRQAVLEILKAIGQAKGLIRLDIHSAIQDSHPGSAIFELANGQGVLQLTFLEDGVSLVHKPSSSGLEAFAGLEELPSEKLEEIARNVERFAQQFQIQVPENAKILLFVSQSPPKITHIVANEVLSQLVKEAGLSVPYVYVPYLIPDGNVTEFRNVILSIQQGLPLEKGWRVAAATVGSPFKQSGVDLTQARDPRFQNVEGAEVFVRRSDGQLWSTIVDAEATADWFEQTLGKSLKDLEVVLLGTGGVGATFVTEVERRGVRKVTVTDPDSLKVQKILSIPRRSDFKLLAVEPDDPVQKEASEGLHQAIASADAVFSMTRHSRFDVAGPASPLVDTQRFPLRFKPGAVVVDLNFPLREGNILQQAEEVAPDTLRANGTGVVAHSVTKIITTFLREAGAVNVDADRVLPMVREASARLLSASFKPPAGLEETMLTLHNEAGQKIVVTQISPSSAGPHPVAIVLHGLSGSRKEPPIQGLGRHLAGHGDVVLIPDLHNNGPKQGNESDGVLTDYSLEGQIDDVAQVFQYLRSEVPSADLSSVILAGHSYGGMLARHIAAKIARGDDPRFQGIGLQAVIDLSGVISPRGSTLMNLKRVVNQPGAEWKNASQALNHWAETGSFKPYGGQRYWLQGWENYDATADLTTIPAEVPYLYVIGDQDAGILNSNVPETYGQGQYRGLVVSTPVHRFLEAIETRGIPVKIIPGMAHAYAGPADVPLQAMPDTLLHVDQQLFKSAAGLEEPVSQPAVPVEGQRVLLFAQADSYGLAIAEALRGGPHRIVGIVTMPNASGLIRWGREQGIPVWNAQDYFDTLFVKQAMQTRADFRERMEVLAKELRQVKADVGISANFYHIPPPVAAVPGKKFLNIHPSKLPKYRGGFTIPALILNHEKETWVTIHEVTDDTDGGTVAKQVGGIPIGESDDAVAVQAKVIPVATQALLETLNDIGGGTYSAAPQGPAELPHAWGIRTRKVPDPDRNVLRVLNEGLLPRLAIDWPAATTEEILTRVRAFQMKQNGLYAYTDSRSQGLLYLTKAEPVQGFSDGKPGEVLRADPDNGVVVKTADGAVKVWFQGISAGQLKVSEILMTTTPVSRVTGIPESDSESTRPLIAGLEEAQDTDLLARVRRIAAQDQLQAIVRDLAQPGFTYQIVDQSLAEEFPELAVLAELHQGILIDRSNDAEETRALVVELISRSAYRVDYYGYSERAGRFKEIAERALIRVEIPPPAKLELLLAQLLSNLAGLNDPNLLEARLERLGLTLQRVASWLDQLA